MTDRSSRFFCLKVLCSSIFSWKNSYICGLVCAHTIEIINKHYITMKLTNLFVPTQTYERPVVDSVDIESQGPLCGSFNGAQIPGYGEVDPWEED